MNIWRKHDYDILIFVIYMWSTEHDFLEASKLCDTLHLAAVCAEKSTCKYCIRSGPEHKSEANQLNVSPGKGWWHQWSDEF